MATQCWSTAWLERVRITETDECGVPLDEFVVSDGTVSLTIASEVEAGVEIFQRKSNGLVCINRKQPDTLKRKTVSIDWCEVDPDVFRLVTGSRAEVDGDDTVGYREVCGTLGQSFALEGWTALGDDPCDPGGQSYGYFLIPLLRGGLIGGTEFGSDATTFTTEGSYTQAGAQWDTGPYAVIGSPASPTVLDDPILFDECFLHRLTQVPPPAAVCGAQTMSPGSP